MTFPLQQTKLMVMAVRHHKYRDPSTDCALFYGLEQLVSSPLLIIKIENKKIGK